MSREWLGVAPDGTGGTVGVTLLAVALLGFAVWYPLHLRRWWPWERDGG